MRCLLILAHPRRDSLCGALLDACADGAREAGVECRELVLIEMLFDLNESPEHQPLEPDLVRAQRDIHWAQHLVFVYPTWWGIYGAGPVGLMAACSAMIKGASQVMVVDKHKDRLELAEKVGAIAIDDTEGHGVERILELTGGKGADRGCECVGYQCCTMHREEVPNLTMNNLVHTVKATGRIGVVGVFIPEDPGAADKLAKRGQLAFDFGQFWFKGQSIGTGQANVKAYNRLLSRLIEHDKVKPSWIVSHELPLEKAPEAYKNFDQRKRGWTKVVLKPGASA